MGSVIVIGSINQDLVVECERHPEVGETLSGTSLAYLPGGKGANQAIAAARAGAPTKMVGAVGDDAYGRELRANLQSSGVEVSGVAVHSSEPTGVALITVAQGDNSIIVVAGANATVQAEQLDPADLTAEDVVVAQFETPPAETAKVFAQAQRVGATTVLNPAPAAQVAPELLSSTSVLVVNESEFALVFGLQTAAAVSGELNWVSTVGASFAGTLVITLGADGALLWSAQTHQLLPAIKVQAVDSTGAGDCFVGYLAAGLAAGSSVQESLSIAMAAAALKVTRKGAAKSMPLREDVERFVATKSGS